MTTGTNWGSWIGPIAGAVGSYFGAQQGGPQSTTQTHQTQMSPEMRGQWDAFRQFSNQAAAVPYAPYGGSRVAGLTEDQLSSMDQVRANAQGGSEQRAGSQALQSFLSGPQAQNPYLDGMLRQTQDDVQARMGQGAFSSGSFGNSGVAGQTAKALADSSNNVRYGAYEQDRQRQFNAIPQALAYQNQNFQNANQLLQVGAMQQNQGQRYLDDASSRWQEMRDYPRQQMSFLGAPLGYNMGQTSTQSATQPGNRWASALGGGLLGLQLGNNMAGGAQQQRPAPIYDGYGFMPGMGS